MSRVMGKIFMTRQIKPRILELSIRRRQSNSSFVLTCFSCEEIDCYRGVVSAGQLGATAARTNHIFAVFFPIFELEGITKHLMTGPTGNSEFCFPSPVIKCLILDAILGLLGSFYIYNVLYTQCKAILTFPEQSLLVIGRGRHLSLFPPFSMTWQMPESVYAERLYFKDRK